MFKKNYSNFVKASSPERCSNSPNRGPFISGQEAQRIYLEELGNIPECPTQNKITTNHIRRTRKPSYKPPTEQISNKDLFLTVQDNDVDKLRSILDSFPDKIKVIDDYGWSLLMIACQASSVDTAKELLKRGADTSIRDKAGNSAQSLVIKNKNYVLADVLLSHRQHDVKTEMKEPTTVVFKEEYFCEICNKTFPDKGAHLSSTIHNISASKGKKIPTSYVIPQTNRGYQIMLKVGWDKDSGLGRDGSGKKYPIKAVQKKDRKGLGHEKKKHKEQPTEDNVKHKNKKKLIKEHHHNKRFEINFRREFY